LRSEQGRISVEAAGSGKGVADGPGVTVAVGVKGTGVEVLTARVMAMAAVGRLVAVGTEAAGMGAQPKMNNSKKIRDRFIERKKSPKSGPYGMLR